MSKKTIILCSTLSLFGCVNSNMDLGYIEIPVPNQIADLRDEDSDGVINARDLCSGTIIGSKIDNDGCPTEEVLKNNAGVHVLYDNDSYEIKNEFLNQIENLSDFLKKYPETSVEIKGYASKVGSENYNMSLSFRRAEVVKLKLLTFGVPNEQVRIIGFGDSQLEIDGQDEQSHARNRRVVANVVGYDKGFIKEWTIYTRLPAK